MVVYRLTQRLGPDLITSQDYLKSRSSFFNPLSADIFLHKPWKTKGLFQLEITINVLVGSFPFI